MTNQQLGVILKAARLATLLHEGQKYGDGTPYMGHVFGVVNRVLEDGGDWIDVVIAFLHDVGEDVPEGLDIVRTEFAEWPEVVEAVEALTKTEEQDYHADYLMGQVFLNERAARTKKADMWYNHKREGGRDSVKYRRAWAMITAL